MPKNIGVGETGFINKLIYNFLKLSKYLKIFKMLSKKYEPGSLFRCICKWVKTYFNGGP